MNLPSRADIQKVASVVYKAVQPTAQCSWPLLNERVGTELWIKHENQTPVGAFKIRGSIAYFRHLKHSRPDIETVVTATRGNHGQAVAYAARREKIQPLIYIPRGNSEAKNRAMRALGAKLIESGDDFQSAREEAVRRAQAEGLHYVPSFHELLIAGVATYSFELFSSVAQIDVAYVPIGLGSGICGMIAVREALNLRTEIVGVVSDQAPAYYHSFEEKKPVESPVSTRLADGLACRTPEPEALDIICRHVSRIVRVTDDEVAAGMRVLFDDTHNVAEGAGAAGLAAVLKDKEKLHGKRVATILTGGNVDREVYRGVLHVH